jgi:hypothetical protein
VSENVIELNGKRYDALTGKLLGASHARVAETLAPTTPGWRMIDGVVRSPALRRKTPPPTAKTIAKAMPVPLPPSKIAPKTSKRKHDIAKAVPAHQPQHAKTLMRRSVHKPTIKTQVPAEVAPKTPSTIAVKHSVTQIDPRRKAHATAVLKHAAVRRFHTAGTTAESLALHVPAPPKIVPHIPVKTAPSGIPHTQISHKDMFEAAISHASSHQEPAHKPRRSRRRRMVNTMAGIVAFLVIGSFFAWLNIPNIQLHVASVQAGFKAEMPEFRPTGYALEGGVQRFGNTVNMSFRSGSNQFHLTEQPSDWNSQTLLENTLALSGEHETLQVNGRTVYVYGNGNAAWVDGGVRYDLTGNASLDSKDITHIVGSL